MTILRRLTIWIACLTVAMVMMALVLAGAARAQEASGDWHGALSSPLGDLRIARIGALPAPVSSNPVLEAAALPVTRQHLRDEGLSPVFVEYMNNWKGFVAAEEAVEA